jgi:hypothetical protein
MAPVVTFPKCEDCGSDDAHRCKICGKYTCWSCSVIINEDTCKHGLKVEEGHGNWKPVQ